MSRIGYQPGSSERNNVISFMEDHVRNYPSRPALRWCKAASLKAWIEAGADPMKPIEHEEISYGDFAATIDRTAKGLMDLGIVKGDRVIIFLPMGLGMYSAMFAIQRLGAIAVFLDSWARASQLGASAECVKPTAMISFPQAFDLIEQVPEFKQMKLRIVAGLQGQGKSKGYDADLEVLMRTPGPSPIAAVESEFTALITFTTGSSGKPKGANRTHRFLAAQHEALSHVVPYHADDRDMPAFPIFSLNNLASGVTTIIPGLNLAQPMEYDSAILACQTIHEKLTCATLSPSMLVNLARFCTDRKIPLDGLRRVATGGAPISKDNVRDFAAVAKCADIWVLYGSTEVEPMAHIEAKEMLKQAGPSDPEILEEGVNVGHIDGKLEYKFLKIFDGPIDRPKESADGRWVEEAGDLEVGHGQIGEFVVTGDHVCRDYYNNPEAFRSTKIMDRKDRVWHRTGDLAFIDPRGYLWMVGRVHNAIRRGQEYFFPVRPEVLIKRLPGCRQGAFLGMPDTELGNRTSVILEPQDPKTFDRELALSELERLFKKNKIPVDSIYIVDAVPMDPRHHSKVEYTVLRDRIVAEKLPDLAPKRGERP